MNLITAHCKGNGEWEWGEGKVPAAAASGETSSRRAAARARGASRAVSNDKGQKNMRRLLIASMTLLALVPLTAGQEPAPGRTPAEAPFLTSELLFPLEHWHNHASMIVELPGGDLLTCWFHGSG